VAAAPGFAAAGRGAGSRAQPARRPAFPAGHLLHAPWAILHDRGWLELAGVQLRTSYPVLPWIGVIALGYGIGPWFGRACEAAQRQRRLLVAGAACLLGFGCCAR
jgi:uncharacterized membrane protein